ncbi:MAG TPA: hypothetical protein VHG92_02780 [Afifellaceae bacterium]|nr:hypothetical protein [Afifellaceae bacterium]
MHGRAQKPIVEAVLRDGRFEPATEQEQRSALRMADQGLLERPGGGRLYLPTEKGLAAFRRGRNRAEDHRR